MFALLAALFRYSTDLSVHALVFAGKYLLRIVADKQFQEKFKYTNIEDWKGVS